MQIAVGKTIPDLEHVIEGSHYALRHGVHLLLISLRDPRPEEIFSVEKGPFELRVIGNDICLFILFRFGRPDLGGLYWSDARFEWYRLAPEDRVLPKDDKAMWTFALLDTNTQIVCALRQGVPDQAFQRAFIHGIEAQAQRRPPTTEEADAYVARMERFSSRTLAEMAGRRTLDPRLGDLSYIASLLSFKQVS